MLLKGEVASVFKDTRKESEIEVKNMKERWRDMLDRIRRLNISFRRRRNRMQKIKYLKRY